MKSRLASRMMVEGAETRPGGVLGAKKRLGPSRMFSAVRTMKECGPDASADRGLAAAGVGAAMVAASFAGYMIATESGPDSVKAGERRILGAALAKPRDAMPDLSRTGGEAEPFDFDATGSIIRGRDEAAVEARRDILPAIKADGAKSNPPGVAPSYVLRFVHKGVAIVQSGGKSYVVAPGASLPQAGRVLSIDKRAGRWVVVAEAGLIVEAR
ncbi:hypothetical protein [Methylocapsa palsarum]|nr:hypothetical protein [Methylocapsa palsarum]